MKFLRTYKRRSSFAYGLPLIFVLCCCTTYAAQLPSDHFESRIRLSINYLQAEPGDTLELSVNNALLYVTEGRNYLATCDSKGVFGFDLPVKWHTGYFTLIRKRSSNRDVDLLYPQLWESGDNIYIQIDHKDTKLGVYTNAIFSGNGSKKYTLNQVLSKTKIKIDIHEKRYDGNIYDGIPDTLTNTTRKKLEILDSYKSSISKDAYFIIKADLMALVLSESLNNIAEYYTSKVKGDSNNQKLYIEKFTATLFPVKNYDIADYYLAASKGYLNYISRLCTIEISMRDTYNNQSLFESIMEHCSGNVREQMLVAFFTKAGSTQEAPVLFTKAAKVIFNQERKATIEQVLENFSKSHLSNYRFTDAAGKEVRISDFKGKVLLIDIWFTGCGYCGLYYKNVLSKIEDKYGENKNIAILSISADRSKEMWQRSISENSYTGKSAVNVYTNGDGFKHPMFLKYAIESAPTVILVDKRGMIKDYNSYSLKNYESLITALENL